MDMWCRRADPDDVDTIDALCSPESGTARMYRYMPNLSGGPCALRSMLAEFLAGPAVRLPN